MTTFTVSDARALVRRNLDEMEPNGSVMYADETGEDNTSMDNIIARFLPDAINEVHAAAPAALLEGTDETPSAVAVSTDGVLSFSLAASSAFLRLVAFKAADSGIVVTDVIPEASPEGRKQLNRHIRGRADRPRLVIMQDLSGGPRFKYYTIDTPDTYIENPASAIEKLSCVMEQVYVAPTLAEPDPSYNISSLLRQNIIDLLTARVMEAFNDARAQLYIQRANNYPSL